VADPTPHRDTGEGPARGSTGTTPRWAKVIGIIVGLVLLFAVVMLAFGGGFGFDHSGLSGVHG
jgi:hypothetical protein